jgi:hypothetical protein
MYIKIKGEIMKNKSYAVINDELVTFTFIKKADKPDPVHHIEDVGIISYEDPPIQGEMVCNQEKQFPCATPKEAWERSIENDKKYIESLMADIEKMQRHLDKKTKFIDHAKKQIALLKKCHENIEG